MTGSSIAVNIPLSGRAIALACLVMASLGVAAGIAMSWPPAWDPKAGLAGLLPLLPAAGGLFGVFAGAICLLITSPAAPMAVPLATGDTGADLAPALRTIFRDFNHLLMDERDRLNAMQQAFGSTTQEAMAASGRLSRLATAAGEAEARLNAGIAQAEEALRQPAAGGTWAADAAQRVEQALPQLADLIRHCSIEQSQAAAAALEAAVTRIATETQGPLQDVRGAARETAVQIAALGETAAALRQDVAGLDTASRGIATASAMVVSRVGEAVVNLESALATLPSAAAGVTEAAEHAAHAMTEAAVTLTTDAAALDQSHQAAMRVVQDLRRAGDDLSERLDIAEKTLTEAAHATARQVAEATGKVDAALDRIPAAADQATQMLSGVVATLRTDGDALRSAGRELAADSAASVARALDVVAHVEAAMRQVPAALKDAADQATRTLSEATAVLCADSAALEASGRETVQAAEMLLTAGREAAAGLVEVERQIRDAGGDIRTQSAAALEHFTQLPAAVGAITAAAGQAAQTLTDAADALRAEGAGITASLGAASGGALRAVDMLDSVGQNAAAIGAALDRLPGLTAEVAEAAGAAARALTGGADSVATASTRLNQAAADNDRTRQQVADLADRLDIATAALADRTGDLDAAGQRSTAAITGLLDRTEAAGAALDMASRSIGGALQAQIIRLSEVTSLAEAQAPLLPAATAGVAAAAERLTEMADAARAALPNETERAESVAVLAGLSADLHDAMRRFETVLARQDGVFPALFDAMGQVETAVAEVRAALVRPPEASGDLVVSGSAAPAALAATLEHLEGVAARTALLLRQTEALAEAVMHGRAPGLPLLLADRTPALLADVDTTIRRLRSVATALALASDGPPRAAGAAG